MSHQNINKNANVRVYKRGDMNCETGIDIYKIVI